MAKIASTPQLIQLAERGIMRGFNRQANIVELKRYIDPNGRHVAVFHALVDDANAVVRVSWMVKFKGDDDPHPLEIDCELQFFNKLEDISLPPADDDEEEETFA